MKKPPDAERVRQICDHLTDKCALDTIAEEIALLARDRDEARWSLEAATRRIETLQEEVGKWERLAHSENANALSYLDTITRLYRTIDQLHQHPHNATAKCS